MKQSAIAIIEKNIRKNLENRGLDQVEIKGSLETSARSLMSSETVLILTGFVIRDTLTGETDGPLGAASLGNALVKLGKNIAFVTDAYSEKMLRNACEVLALMAPIEIATHSDIDFFCTGLIDKYKPTHVVAIERPGRNVSGRCFSMRGEDLSDLVPNTDILLTQSHARGIETIAIGDGGNEVGMGLVKERIITLVENGAQICAEVSADHLVLAGVSNWGGHALSGALSILCERNLLHSTNEECEMLRRIVSVGAVDGCTKQSEATVDGLSLIENIEMLEMIRDTLAAFLNRVQY